jgi:hypothetical protein
MQHEPTLDEDEMDKAILGRLCEAGPCFRREAAWSIPECQVPPNARYPQGDFIVDGAPAGGAGREISRIWLAVIRNSSPSGRIKVTNGTPPPSTARLMSASI